MKAKYKIGDQVSLTSDALTNYGEQYSGKKFTISHVATKYMPASEFYAKGKPNGYHPGFDASAYGALYDCIGLHFSLYEWEVE